MKTVISSPRGSLWIRWSSYKKGSLSGGLVFDLHECGFSEGFTFLVRLGGEEFEGLRSWLKRGEIRLGEPGHPGVEKKYFQ